MADISIPFDRQAWNAEQCAAYIGISKSHFLNCIRYAEGFPAPLPAKVYRVNGKEKQLDDRWSAAAVAAWMLGETTQVSRKQAANA